MTGPNVLALILAGGKGNRLFPLTAERSKPAVPFGGRYRIIDFVLSNMINSQIFSIYMLVQYKSQSLIEHIRRNWVLSSLVPSHFITLVPPQMRRGSEWFQGTADAVNQNLNLIRHNNPDLVAIFGADHIYRMDIRQMVDFHLARNASVTVAARPVPLSEGSSFGIISTEADGKITGFLEKPKRPAPMPTDPTRCYASMGNYIFNTDVLFDALADAERHHEHDFGGYVLPKLVPKGQLYAYDFSTNVIAGQRPTEETGYWRDVGTIRAYWEAHRDMLGENPVFDIDNQFWPIRPSRHSRPAAKILGGEITNSVIAEGSIVHPEAVIRNSTIRRGVVIERGAVIEDSVIMDNVVVRGGAKLRRAIVDRNNVLDSHLRIGCEDQTEEFWGAHFDPSGIAVIPKRPSVSRQDEE